MYACLYFIHRNLTEHRLVIFDFNVLTSNKIKAPFELSSSNNTKTFQFSHPIPKIKKVKGNIKYGTIKVRLKCE